MKFEVKTEVGFDIEYFVGRILGSFGDYIYDLDYDNEYELLSEEQKKELKIAVFEKIIETLKEEED